MIRVTVGCDIGHMVRPQPPKLKTSGAFPTPSYHLQSNRFPGAAWNPNTAGNQRSSKHFTQGWIIVDDQYMNWARCDSHALPPTVRHAEYTAPWRLTSVYTDHACNRPYQGLRARWSRYKTGPIPSRRVNLHFGRSTHIPCMARAFAT